MSGYLIKRVLGISGGGNFWVHRNSNFDPIAVWALVEVRFTEGHEGNMVIPLTAWEIDDLNERAAKKMSIPSATLSFGDVYHSDDFEEIGSVLKANISPRGR
jgi:hypothetical protein